MAGLSQLVVGLDVVAQAQIGGKRLRCCECAFRNLAQSVRLLGGVLRSASHEPGGESCRTDKLDEWFAVSPEALASQINLTFSSVHR